MSPTGGEEQAWDCFISYPRSARSAVQALCKSLAAERLSLWLDESEISDKASITRGVDEGLTRCTTFVAYFTPEYTHQAACRQELIAALLAQETHTAALERIIVINPASSNAHIYPIELRDARYHGAPSDPADPDAWKATASAIATHVSSFSSPLGAALHRDRPPWYGASVQGTTRFVGHWNSLWELHGNLMAREHSLTAQEAPVGLDCVFLRGLGGAGKTQLAIHYARVCGSVWPGGIHWLNAAASPDSTEEDRNASLFDQLQTVALGLKIALEEKSLLDLKAEIGERIDASQDRALWIVDDMPAEASAAEVHSWMGPSEHTRTLITTRARRFAWEHLGQTIDLGQLEESDALDLILKHRPAKDEGELAHATEIVRLLGCYALSVDVTGALLQDSGFAEVHEELLHPSQDALELAKELAGELPDQHSASTAATLYRSMQLLGADGLAALQLSSALAQAPIPDRIVGRVVDVLGADDGANVESDQRGSAAIEDLNANCLCERSLDDVQAPLFAVHQILRRSVERHRETQPSAELRNDLVSAAKIVCAAELKKSDDLQEHIALRAWIPHARHLVRSGDDLSTAELLGWTARWDYERGASRRAQEGYQRQLAIRSQKLGDESQEAMRSRTNLGAALYQLQDFDGAGAIFEELLATQRVGLGPEHPDTLSTMNNLGTVLLKRREFERARDLFEEEHALSAKVNGESAPDTLVSLNNLALVYSELGESDRALEIHREEVRLCREVNGAEHQDTLVGEHNLAETYRELSLFKEAKDLHRRVLDVRTRLLEPEHHEILRSQANLARTLHELKEFESARELLEEVLAIRDQRDGPDKPLTTRDAWSLYETLGAIDPPAAAGVRSKYLAWLVEADVDSLEPPQDVVRNRVLALDDPVK